MTVSAQTAILTAVLYSCGIQVGKCSDADLNSFGSVDEKSAEKRPKEQSEGGHHRRHPLDES